MSTVAVHGAAGFVAASLVPQLLADCLILIDRRPVPEELIASAEARGIECTIIQAERVATVQVRRRIDTLVVLAGETNVDAALVDPDVALRRNTDVAMDVGQWIYRCQDSRLVYLSTDEVLGPSCVPLGEEAPLRPTQPYAVSKAAAELVLHTYRETYGLDVVTIRSCNLVGAHQRAPKLIPVAVSQLYRGGSVPIFGNGSHVREWMDVADLVHSLVLAIDGVLPAGVFHCTSKIRLNVLDVVRLVAEALSIKPRWHHVSDRLVHDQSYSMSSGLLESFGWSAMRDPQASMAHAAQAMWNALERGEVVTTPSAQASLSEPS